jgi:hypothetical protein
MNKVATLGLAFLLIFSGCLGFGKDDISEQEEKETIEPVHTGTKQCGPTVKDTTVTRPD